MKTKTVAATAILALMLAGIASVAFAHPEQTSQPSPEDQTLASSTVQTKGSNQKGHDDRGEKEDSGNHGHGHALDLKVGDTITLSNLDGRFRQVGNESIRGNASGSFTFTVTGVFKQGYVLSITSGTIKVGDQTYTVNEGTVQTGHYGREMTGQGTAGSGVQFIIHAKIHGTAAAPKGMVMLDLENGSTEYMVLLRAVPSS